MDGWRNRKLEIVRWKSFWKKLPSTETFFAVSFDSFNFNTIRYGFVLAGLNQEIQAVLTVYK